jgi:hypothetical protein
MEAIYEYFTAIHGIVFQKTELFIISGLGA